MIDIECGVEPPLYFKTGNAFEKCVMRIICRRDGDNWIATPCFILSTGIIVVDNDSFTLDDFALHLLSGRLTVDLPDDIDWLSIKDFCSLDVKQAFGGADNEGFLAEVRDAIRQLNGEPGMIASCRQALKRMKADPTDENRIALQRAYNVVPGHLRCWVGTLDTKDSEVRELLGINTSRTLSPGDDDSDG